jgi:hypothetical protein
VGRGQGLKRPLGRPALQGGSRGSEVRGQGGDAAQGRLGCPWQVKTEAQEVEGYPSWVLQRVDTESVGGASGVGRRHQGTVMRL